MIAVWRRCDCQPVDGMIARCNLLLPNAFLGRVWGREVAGLECTSHIRVSVLVPHCNAYEIMFCSVDLLVSSKHFYIHFIPTSYSDRC